MSPIAALCTEDSKLLSNCRISVALHGMVAVLPPFVQIFMGV
jgi:hypothetical protein